MNLSSRRGKIAFFFSMPVSGGSLVEAVGGAISKLGGGIIGYSGASGGFWKKTGVSDATVAVAVTVLAGLALAAVVYCGSR